MTWNVQNLLPVGHEDGPASVEEYQAKLAAIAALIDQVEPDVVALQEVGPPEVLADLDAALTDVLAEQGSSAGALRGPTRHGPDRRRVSRGGEARVVGVAGDDTVDRC